MGVGMGLGFGGGQLFPPSSGLGLGFPASAAASPLERTRRRIVDSFGRYVAARIPTLLDRVFIRGMDYDEDDYYDD